MSNITFNVIDCESKVDKLKQCIKSSETSYADASFNILKAPYNSDDLASNAAVAFTCIILKDDITRVAELETLVNQVLKNTSAAPLLVLTDSDDIENSFRGLGVKFFMPLTDIKPKSFTAFLNVISEHEGLSAATQKLENMYLLAENRFKDVTQQFTDWMWEIDLNLNITYTSSRRVTARGARVGAPFGACFLPEEQRCIENDFETLIDNPSSFADKDYWSYDTHGGRVCWSLSGNPIYDNANALIGFRGIAVDVSAERASVERLYHLHNRDTLTNLFNRKRFYEDLETLLKQCVREQRQAAVLVLNIDKFSMYNDSYGHKLGDKVLVGVAEILKDNVRSTDTVSRIAGDEFAIIMPDYSLEQATKTAQSILTLIQEKPLSSEFGVHAVQASAGIVAIPEHGRTADQVLTHVESALHTAKTKGRNRLEIYSDNATDTLDSQKKLEDSDFLHKCLADAESRVQLFFQPIVSLHKEEKQREFYEVLVRFTDEHGAVVAPRQLIAIGEEFGLIANIDLRVALDAIKCIKLMQSQGRSISLSVNISGQTFDSMHFLSAVTEAMREAKIPRGALVFEVTETSIFHSISQAKNFMEQLSMQGVHFALDNCGSGYSSLQYIKELPFQFIKIGGMFVKGLLTSKEDAVFIKALHDIAQEKAIATIGEMVERKEIADKLQSLGVDFAQGYYYAMPTAHIPDPDEVVH